MNDRARAAVARRCVSYSAVSPPTMNAPVDVVPGRGAERPAWGRRTLCGGGACRSLQRRRRRRRTVQRPAARDSAGRLTCGHDEPCPPKTVVWLHGCASRPTQPVTLDLAMHERAEARVAVQRAAVSATTPSWAALRSDERPAAGSGGWRARARDAGADRASLSSDLGSLSTVHEMRFIVFYFVGRSRAGSMAGSSL